MMTTASYIDAIAGTVRADSRDGVHFLSTDSPVSVDHWIARLVQGLPKDARVRITLEQLPRDEL